MPWNLCFWEPSISPHKIPLFRELQAHPEVSSVRCIAERDLSQSRKELGWSKGATEAINLQLAPSKQEIFRIFEEQVPGTVNFIAGLRWVPTIVTALNAAQSLNARYGIMSEPRASEGWRGRARWVSSWLSERPVRRTADFVLAIGRNGPPWFRSVGYPPERIFPFAYFVPPISPQPRQPGDGVMSIGYMGRLTPEKGILEFLLAIDKLDETCVFSVAGAGPCEHRVREFSESSDGKLDFVGAVPISKIGGFLSRLDILVVPSQTTDDGWGAVIGEALLAGVPVVASRKAGASICLDDLRDGLVVPSGTADEIADAVKKLISEGSHCTHARMERSRRAHRRLTASIGAQYLLNILSSTYAGSLRPTPFYVLPDEKPNN